MVSHIGKVSNKIKETGHCIWSGVYGGNHQEGLKRETVANTRKQEVGKGLEVCDFKVEFKLIRSVDFKLMIKRQDREILF